MEVDISKLPKEILDQIPRSIKSYRNLYELDELPSPIQYLIRDYIEKLKQINYDLVFDIVPQISEYGDFRALKTVDETVITYIKNFFQTMVGDYPFDASIGTLLKKYLHSKDTESSKQLIEAEIQMILLVISADLGVNVVLNSVDITPISMGAYTEYTVYIDISISNKSKLLNITVIG
jgi:hypothetical protein